MGQLRESRWVELNLVSGLGDACLLKRLPFGGTKSVGERPDGASATHLVGKFRADFRLSIMMTTVRRAAAMQLGTGLPSCSVRGGVALLPESTLFCGAEREVGPEELEL